VHGAIGAHAQRRAERLSHAIGADGHHDDLVGGARVLELQRLFDRVGVIRIDLELDVVFLDPGSFGVHVETCVLMGNLLQAHHDLHGGEPPPARESRRLPESGRTDRLGESLQ
jgi:hypothetical protein